MKKNHYARKKRQLKVLVSKLNTLLQDSNQQVNKQIALIASKIKRLVKELAYVIQRWELKRIVGTAAVILGLSFSSSAIAQTSFGPKQENPFGLTTEGYILPVFVDIDNDGDQDLIAASPLHLIFRENTGDRFNPAFAAPIVDPFSFTPNGFCSDIGVVDIDGDGDFDLMFRDSHDIKYYENTGSIYSAQFDTMVLNPFGISGVLASGAPSFADLDGDGDFDMYINHYNYFDVQFFENTGSNDFPSFAAPIVEPNGMGYYIYNTYSSVIFADIDYDGDLDIMLSVYGATVYMQENVGNPQNPDFALPESAPYGIDIGYDFVSMLAFVDLDGDGDFDLFANGYTGNFNYFENTSSHIFADPEQNPYDLDLGYDTVTPCPAFVDIDNDGDLDLFIAEADYYSMDDQITFYENIGDENYPLFDSGQLNPFSLSDIPKFVKVDFADMDGDGDQDMVSGSVSDDVVYYKNIGTASNPIFDTPVTLTPNYNSFNSDPCLVDIDNDGDFDLLLHVNYNNQYGEIWYYENTGDANTFDFSNSYNINPFGLHPMTDYGNISMADVDNDGDLDLLMGSTDYSFMATDGFLYFFENIGDENNPNFTYPVQNPNGLHSMGYLLSSIEMVDIDSDGDFDVFLGNYYVPIHFFKNTKYTVGVDEVVSNDKLTIYPNPVKDVLQFNTDKAIQKVVIYNMMGQKVLQINMSNDKISLNKLDTGFYLIKVYLEDGSLLTRKIQKQ